MRILILGGSGMLGHQLFKTLCQNNDVKVTLHHYNDHNNDHQLFSSSNSYCNIDVLDTESLREIMSSYKPEIVLNAIGIIKQREDSKDIVRSLEVNALFPHRLAILCSDFGARLIHFSTDCIFSGKKGNYTETDISDALDLYGKTKFLGEVLGLNSLTIRSSIIGRELTRHTSLLDWFLNQSGEVNGFTNSIFSGFTTIEMSRIVEKVIFQFPDKSGIYNVSSDPISKFELLSLIKKIHSLDIEIVPYPNFYCDRSLNSSNFRREFSYNPPSWPKMISELKV